MMIQYSSAKKLITHLFLVMCALVLSVPASAQSRDIQRTPDSRGITDFIVEPPTLVLPQNQKGRILAQVKQGPIDWQAAFDQISRDVRPFRPAPQSTTIMTNQPGNFRADERVMRTMTQEMQQLSPTMRSIGRPKLPILLPPDPPMLAVYKRMAADFPDARALQGKMAFFHGLDDHYAATFEMNGLDVMVNGSRIEYTSTARQKRKDQSRAMTDGTRVNPIERDDVGVSMSFNRFGAAYIIEIACAQPQTDDRCSKDNFINEVYQKLLLFGGRP